MSTHSHADDDSLPPMPQALATPASPEIAATERSRLAAVRSRFAHPRPPRQWLEDLRKLEAHGEHLSAAQRRALFFSKTDLFNIPFHNPQRPEQ